MMITLYYILWQKFEWKTKNYNKPTENRLQRSYILWKS